MLLRRITQHVKDQNWFAVFLDFFIVVVGILIAFQITNWNERRSEALQQARLLERLTEEFILLEQEWADDAESYKTLVDSTGTLIKLLRADKPPEDATLLQELIWQANYFYETPSQSAAYQELIASGSLSLVSNRELREALFRYGDLHDRLNTRSTASYSFILDPYSNYFKAVEWSEDPDDWVNPETAILSYDWETLTQSKSELQSWQAVQSDSSRNVTLIHKEIEKILTLLEAEVN